MIIIIIIIIIIINIKLKLKNTVKLQKIHLKLEKKTWDNRTGNTFSKKIKGKSKYTICLTERTFIDEIEGEIYL